MSEAPSSTSSPSTAAAAAPRRRIPLLLQATSTARAASNIIRGVTAAGGGGGGGVSSRQGFLRENVRYVLMFCITLIWMHFNSNRDATFPNLETRKAATTSLRSESASSSIMQDSDVIEVKGAVTMKSKTSPPFHIWLFPPKEDIISKKIYDNGVYEPEETDFTQLASSSTTTTTTTTTTNNKRRRVLWAVDIGANVGFHTLHMASSGMNVIAFEPSPDTASLLYKSIHENGFNTMPSSAAAAGSKGSGGDSGGGIVNIIRAAAGESHGLGRLVRHSDSPGMTILQVKDDHKHYGSSSSSSSALPFQVSEIVGDNIEIVRPESVINKIVLNYTQEHTDGQKQRQRQQQQPVLQLLKVDAEGHELHAFKGVNLRKFPFEFLTFEFFPELLWKAGQTDPLDLLLYVQSVDYQCSTKPTPNLIFSNEDSNAGIMKTVDDFRSWYESQALPAYEIATGYHVNIYCHKTGGMK